MRKNSVILQFATFVAINLMIFTNTNAQSIRVGVTSGLNSTWLINKNVLDANDELDLSPSFGGRIGFESVFSLNEVLGFSVGLNISKHNQKTTGFYYNPDFSENNFEEKTSLTYLDIPLLLRLNSNKGAYFEIGPQFGFLTKNSHDLKSFGSDTLINTSDYSNKEYKASYNDRDLSLIVGTGLDLPVSEVLIFTLGARIGIGLSDVTTEYDSEQALFDAASIAEDQISPLSYWSHYETASTEDNSIFSYQKTSRVFFGLNLGLSYTF